MATCPNKNLQEWKDLTASVGENLAYFLWDKYQGEVPQSEVERMSKQDKKIFSQSENVISSKSSPQTLNKIKEAATKMGINIQTLSDYLKGNPEVEAKGINALADAIKKVVAIAHGKEDVALTEEVVHVATAMLEQTDPQLITQLISKIEGYSIYKTVLNEYKKFKEYQLPDGRPDIRKIKKEAVDKLITEIIIRQLEGSTQYPELLQKEQQSIVKQWWNTILEYIRRLYQKSNIDIFESTARRITEGNVEGVGQGVYFQSSNALVNNFYDKVRSFAARMKLHPESVNDKRHYTFDGKRVAKTVTEKVKENASNKLGKRTEEQVFFDEQKRDWGTNLHLYLYNYITTNLIDKDGYKRAVFGSTEINSPFSKTLKTKIEGFAIELINSYSEGTRFILEEMVINEKSKGLLASTIDFMAIEPVTINGAEDVRVDILDWKSMSINKEIEEDIPWFKQGEWREQMGHYSQILINYGLKPSQLRKRRMIPFLMNYKYRVKNDKRSGLVPDSIEIGDLKNPQKTKLYLLPVPVNDESTGNPRIDSLIESLRAQWEKLYSQPRTAEEKSTKIPQLNQLSNAIRQLHIALNFAPLVGVGRTFLKSSYKAIAELKAADYSKMSQEEINKKLRDITSFAETAQKFTELDRIFLSQYPRTGLSTDDKKTLDDLEDIARRSERMLEEVEDVQRLYVVHLATREGVKLEQVETEKGIKIKAEATITGILKTFENPSKLGAKLINLAVKLISRSNNIVNIQYIRKMEEFTKILVPLEEEARQKGKKAFDMIGKMDERGLHLIYKLEESFWKQLTEARKEGNKKFIIANMDMVKFEALAKETLAREEEIINNTEYNSQSEEINTERKQAATKRIRRIVDITRDDFIGFEHPLFNYLLRQCIKEEGHLSTEYKQMSDNARAVWNFFTELNMKARKIGYLEDKGNSFFPLMEATMLQKFKQTNNMATQAKDIVADLYSIRINEENIFSKKDSSTGKVKKRIPKFFTRTDKNVEQLSRDLGKVGSIWLKSLMDYEAATQLEETLQTLLSVEKNKGSLVLNSNGEVIFEGGLPKVNYEVNKNADLMEAVVDDFLYHLEEDLNSIGNTPINAIASKTSKTEEGKERTSLALKKVIKKSDVLVRIMGVGLKPLIGIANWAGFQMQAFIQSGGFYTFKEFERNNMRVTVGAGISTVERGLLNMIVPLNENMTEYLQRKMGRKRNFIDYLNTWSFTDVMMATNSFPERKLQFANGLSFIENSMVVDGKIVNIRQYLKAQDRAKKYEKDSLGRYKYAPEERRALESTFEERVKELKDQKSLIKIAKIEDDRIVIPGVSDEAIADFRTQVTSYITSLNGQMTEGDKAGYRRDTIVTSFMMFKTWIPQLLSARVSGLQKNLQTDEWNYGRMRVFIKTWSQLGFRSIGKMRDIMTGTEEGLRILDEMLQAKRIDHFRKTGQELEITEEEFYDLIRQELSREMKELGTLFTMIGLVMAAQAAEPPEDATDLEKNRYKWWARSINKVSDEISFYYNPTSMETITRGSFLPALGLLSKAGQFITHLEREVGGYIIDNEEMVDKAYPLKYFLNLMPIGAQFQTEVLPYISPELAKEMGIRVSTQSRRR